MTTEQKEKLYNSITAIDDKFIEEAALENEENLIESASKRIPEANGERSGKPEKKLNYRLAWRLGLGIAAALAVAAAGILFFTKILPESRTEEGTSWPTRHVVPDQKDAAAPSEGEMAYVKRWDEKTIDEKYCYLDHEGRTYVNHAVEVPEDRRGRGLVADEVAYGWDPYAEGGEARRNLRIVVYEITDVSTEVAVAVRMIDEEGMYLRAFVVSPSDSETVNVKTLGDLLTDWNLAEDLRIGTVYYYQDKKTWAQGYGTVCFDGAGTAEALKTLFKDTAAARLEELPDGTERIIYSIAIYDDVLGISNLALSVYEGGYLWTNLTSYASIFKIDEADAQAFLDYVTANCEGYIPVYERDPNAPDEGIPENAPLETVVESSKGKE